MTAGIDFLRNVPFFANLPASDLEPLAQRLVTRRYRAGEEIFVQGSPGNSMYIVKSGLVAIVVTGADGVVHTLAQRGPGQFFGEFALLDGLPRSAGVEARQPSELLILSRPEFFIYLEQHPSVAIKLMVLFSARKPTWTRCLHRHAWRTCWSCSPSGMANSRRTACGC
jgi:CRP/FNR family cyclic AMP-dependent transcriptional regulator